MFHHHTQYYFFVLSGFVITSSIVRNINVNSQFNGMEFLVSRIVRIYPPYIFALIFSFFIYLIVVYFNLHGAESYSLDGDKYLARDKVQASYYTYLTSVLMLPGFINGMGTILMNGSLWSIPYEFWLYVLAFLVTASLGRRIFPFIMLSSIFLFLIVSRNYLFLYLTFTWGFGSALFFLSVFIKNNVGFLTKVRLFSKIILAALLICMLLIVIRGQVNNDYGFLVLYSNSLSYVFGFLFLAALVIFYSIFISRWFSCSNVLKDIGKYSYTLYLLHFPILLLAFSFFYECFLQANNLIRFVIFIFLMFANLLLSRSLPKVLENTKSHKLRILYLIEHVKAVLIKKEKIT